MMRDAAPLVVSASVRLRFADAAEAERARAALAPESAGFLELVVAGDSLRLVVDAGNVGRVLATLDDALGCLQAALGAVDSAPQ